ncbi:hypothetical protein [Streptomyces griseomycini]|uniref:Uncharacterized protein n=1 Tax=Streptomyces griseomycini TaxID=66895 RepID=A0A7W7LYX3_9ACTN|nr:hypothetical protein [Streptomyces griseomycini]MBB4898612.1 hypothetical protein [Streptomyces griseomycini]GGQ02675.1 hypothetical protein GCM10010266_27560 [Streptomyces griseomycini]GGR19901.1 hypothetical protein GCM10015536_27040 [Streptomyces griseomycini]
MIATAFRGGAAPRSSLPARSRALFLALVSLLATLPAVGLVVTTGGWSGGHRSEVTVTVTDAGGGAVLPCRGG